MENTLRFAPHDLERLTRDILGAAGTPAHVAATVAEILVNANLSGHDSHGVLRIPAYLRGIESGHLVPAAEPEVAAESAATLRVDGKHGFGHYAARRAMEWAIARAKQGDLCGVSLVRVGHIGRLGEYAEAAARAGYIGIVTVGGGSGAGGSTVPFGGAKGALGTNPISIGVPAEGEAPFLIDFATSMIAEGKIQVARSRGVDLPQGCILDREGRPSVNPADFYDGGLLLPFGGHKGYGLALLTCLLGGLSGHFDRERSGMGGSFMLAIHVESFTPLEEYRQSVRAFLDAIRATPPAPGFAAVRAPGDYEHLSRCDRREHGIELPESTCEQLRESATKLGVEMPAPLVNP